jgi:hypothetical protein
MNEVRASVCNPNSKRESSRYFGILLIGIKTELDGLIFGSNVSIVGDIGGEVGVILLGILGFVLNKRIN